MTFCSNHFKKRWKILKTVKYLKNSRPELYSWVIFINKFNLFLQKKKDFYYLESKKKKRQM